MGGLQCSIDLACRGPGPYRLTHALGIRHASSFNVFPPPLCSDLAFTVIFTIEMLLRILALGGLRAYLSNNWNVFDGFMVLIGWTQLIPTNGSNTAAIRALRALRALRPLRTITKCEPASVCGQAATYVHDMHCGQQQHAHGTAHTGSTVVIQFTIPMIYPCAGLKASSLC